MSAEWTFAQTDPTQELCQIHQFGVKNKQGIEFVICVREYVTPRDPAMRFLATADKMVNQKSGAILPSGWGKTLLDALSDCIRAVNRFPYEA